MTPLGKIDLLIKLLAMEGYHSDLPGDRGGETKYGVASKVWPKEYQELDAKGWTMDAVFLFYNKHFMAAIAGFSALLKADPGLASLLFFGRVHGAGFRHYTDYVQREINAREPGRLVLDGRWGPRTAEAATRLGARQSLVPAMRQYRKELIARRQRAVGLPAYNRGISNRVDRELAFASETDRSQLYRIT